MKNKLMALGLAYFIFGLAGTCFAHQYDILEAAKNKNAIDKKIILDDFLLDDIKQATEYQCNSFENKDIKITMEIGYSWKYNASDGDRISLDIISSYAKTKHKLTMIEHSDEYIFVLVDNRVDWSFTSTPNRSIEDSAARNVEKHNEWLFASTPHAILEVQNKTNNPMVIDLKRSTVKANNYQGRPLKKSDEFTFEYHTGPWKVNITPQEKKEIKIFFLPNTYVKPNTEMLGGYVLNVNGEDIWFKLSAKVNSAKLHWKADTTIDRNIPKYKSWPNNDRSGGIKATEKEKLPGWAL